MFDGIDDLIMRMIDNSPQPVGEEGISWQAYREAEQIKNEKYVPYLAKLIEQIKNKKSRREREKREAIYFILKWIGINSSNKQVPEILMNCLQFETNMYTIGNLLDYIRSQEDYIPNYSDIIQFLNNKRWQIRGPAIDLLGKCKEKEVEIKLLDILKDSNDEYEVGDICSALINIGTKCSIPVLLDKVPHKKQWIRSNVYEALAYIGSSDIVPVFLEGLKDRFYCSKHNALIGVCRLGNEQYIDLVYEKANKIFSYNRILDADEDKTTDLIEALKYLNKYLDNKIKMTKLLNKVKANWESLADNEKEFVQHNFELK